MPTTRLAYNKADNQGDAPTAFAGEVNYGLPIADRFHIERNLGNVEGTRRDRMLLTGMYQLPFGRGRNFMNGGGIKDAFLGGWDLTTVTLLETGPWLTPTISGSADQSNTNVVNRGAIARPDVVSSNFYRRPIAGAVLQPVRICPHPRRCWALRKRRSRHSGGSWNVRGLAWCSQAISHHGETSCALRNDLYQCPKPHQLCPSRHRNRQLDLRSVDRSANRGERRKPYRPSGPQTGLLAPAPDGPRDTRGPLVDADTGPATTYGPSGASTAQSTLTIRWISLTRA